MKGVTPIEYKVLRSKCFRFSTVRLKISLWILLSIDHNKTVFYTYEGRDAH